MRQRSMQRVKEQLQKVAVAVQSGRLKDPVKIGARTSKVLSRNHGYRYYSWEVAGPGQFHFYEDQTVLSACLRPRGMNMSPERSDWAGRICSGKPDH